VTSTTNWYLDSDGDGYGDDAFVQITCTQPGDYIEQSGDCDDVNGLVYPGASEECDGVFNDCDDWGGELASPGAPADEEDDDSDGVVECDYSEATWLGDATVEAGGDCDDFDDVVYPGAEEVCDGQYNDCDDSLYDALDIPSDEDDGDGDGWVECVRFDTIAWAPNVGGAADPNDGCTDNDDCVDCDDDDANTYPGSAENEPDGLYDCTLDEDGDGWGSADVEDPIVVGTDCDDTNDQISPDATEFCEDVNPQVDNDCDGSPNTQGGVAIDAGDDGITLYIDDDLDGFGGTEASDEVNVCQIDDGFSASATDCDDTDVTVFPGATEICNDRDDDCDYERDEVEDLDPDVSGCLDMYRDVDADGYGDDAEPACLCLLGGSDTTEAYGYDYVRQSGDCDDFDDGIHPLSCEDGLDNDGDGLTDTEDSNCSIGLDEWGDAVEVRLEFMDGHDNDCDGYVPAIELDCDDDGALALLPVLRSAAGEAEDLTAETAADLQLERCDVSSDERLTITCWEQELQLECPGVNSGAQGSSGFWMLRYDESDDGYGGRFEGGRRAYPDGLSGDCSTIQDCDDLCASRCPGVDESCDGIDNNCSDVGEGVDSDLDGIPDSMDAAASVAGTLPAVEIDVDSDGYLACDQFTSRLDATQWSSASCSDAVEDEAVLADCDNLCALINPDIDERCDGFTGVCDGAEEGTDADRDQFETCGVYGTGEDDLSEELYVLVWVLEADVVAAAATTAAGDTDGDTDGDTAGDTAAAGTTDTTDTTDTTGLPDLIPLIPPRSYSDDLGGGVIECDAWLYDALLDLVDVETLDGAMAAMNAMDMESSALLDLLDACDAVDGGGCAVMRLTLDEDADEATYDSLLDRAQSSGAVSDECLGEPQQYLSRAVWTRGRILAARQLVVERECERLYGLPCADIKDTSALVSGSWDTIVDATDAFAVERYTWWQELDRFSPEAMTDGALMSCWGDPTDDWDGDAQYTGGDCDDSSGATNRDVAEGPGDLLGIYQASLTLDGMAAACATCLDGIDNNCDGQIDCDDPACAACFVGEGGGCADADSPCSGSGCAFSDRGQGGDLNWPLFAGVMALLAGAVGRRKRRTDA